jgi:hypothetical protein
MPRQITKRGARITRGMALRRSMTGSRRSATRELKAARRPKAPPRRIPQKSPKRAALKVAWRWGQASPLARKPQRVRRTSWGGGAYRGFTSPEAESPSQRRRRLKTPRTRRIGPPPPDPATAS